MDLRRKKKKTTQNGRSLTFTGRGKKFQQGAPKREHHKERGEKKENAGRRG